MAETSLCEIACPGCQGKFGRSLDGQTWIGYKGRWWHKDCAPRGAKKEPNPIPGETIPVSVPRGCDANSYIHGFGDGILYARRAKG